MGNVILTPRLRLRQVSSEEAAEVLQGRQDPERPWIEGYPIEGTLDAARGFLFGVRSGIDHGDFGMYQIVRLEDGRVVGDIGFHGPPAPDRSVMIGYGLAPRARSHGYATEALRALVHWSLSAGGAALVRADTLLDNVASQAVMERAGMRTAGDDDQLRHYVYP
ncbi:MAG: GNAT family N-acetyltransferase [Candidatus Dormibacteraceae bacterium]